MDIIYSPPYKIPYDKEMPLGPKWKGNSKPVQ